MPEKNKKMQLLSDVITRAQSKLKIMQCLIKTERILIDNVTLLRRKEIHIEYCNTGDNVADILTEPLGRIRFELFREELGVLVNPFSIKGEC